MPNIKAGVERLVKNHRFCSNNNWDIISKEFESRHGSFDLQVSVGAKLEESPIQILVRRRSRGASPVLI